MIGEGSGMRLRSLIMKEGVGWLGKCFFASFSAPEKVRDKASFFAPKKKRCYNVTLHDYP